MSDGRELFTHIKDEKQESRLGNLCSWIGLVGGFH